LYVNACNCFLWGLYGYFGLDDLVIVVTNIFGVVINTFLIALTCYYPPVPKLLPRVVVVNPIGEMTLVLEADSRQDRAESRARAETNASHMSKMSMGSTAESDQAGSVLNYSQLSNATQCQVEHVFDLDAVPEGTSVFELEAAPDPEGLGMQLMYVRARGMTTASLAGAFGWGDDGSVTGSTGAVDVELGGGVQSELDGIVGQAGSGTGTGFLPDRSPDSVVSDVPENAALAHATIDDTVFTPRVI
jgi:hypothetical protein